MCTSISFLIKVYSLLFNRATASIASVNLILLLSTHIYTDIIILEISMKYCGKTAIKKLLQKTETKLFQQNCNEEAKFNKSIYIKVNVCVYVCVCVCVCVFPIGRKVRKFT